jgi:hypothetical protein
MAGETLKGETMRRATVLLALVLVLTAAGCSRKAHGPGVATAGGAAASASPTASLDPQEAQRKFAQCMRDHGVEVGDPDSAGGPGGPGRITIHASEGAKSGTNMENALNACQHYLPAGKLATPDPQELEQMRQFAQCMRDHGVDIPDPDANGGGLKVQKGTGSGGNVGVSPDDPAFKAAMEACKDKLPGKTGPSGGPVLNYGGGK